jgi:predicted secreted protein
MAAGEVVVTGCDGSARLQVGEVLTLRLEAQMGAGYGWRLIAPPRLLDSLGPSRAEDAPRTVDGGPGYQVFRFRAIRSGQEQVELSYERLQRIPVVPPRICTLALEVIK